MPKHASSFFGFMSSNSLVFYTQTNTQARKHGGSITHILGSKTGFDIKETGSYNAKYKMHVKF